MTGAARPGEVSDRETSSRISSHGPVTHHPRPTDCPPPVTRVLETGGKSLRGRASRPRRRPEGRNRGRPGETSPHRSPPSHPRARASGARPRQRVCELTRAPSVEPAEAGKGPATGAVDLTGAEDLGDSDPHDSTRLSRGQIGQPGFAYGEHSARGRHPRGGRGAFKFLILRGG